MRSISVKAICNKLNVPTEIAQKIRGLIDKYNSKYPFSRPRPVSTFAKISLLLNANGVESIPKGKNLRSPEITYVDKGDSYDETLMFINGRFRLGCWGAYVEQGNY